MNDYVKNYLNEVKTICDSISVECISRFCSVVENTKSAGGRLFFLGVGGSAGNASHAVNDFRKILGIESYSVSDNVSELTARINDDGWDTCYSNWLKVSRLNENDALVIFSVGGGSATTSQNLVRSIDLAKQTGTKVLSVVSRNGGYCAEKSDVCVLIPVVHSDRITPHAEEWQGIVWHMIVNMLSEKTNEH